MSIRKILCGSAYNCDKCKDSYPFKCSTKIAEEEIKKEIGEVNIMKVILNMGENCNLNNSLHRQLLARAIETEIDKRLFGK